jgi:transposase
VVGQVHLRHRHQEFLKFLVRLDREFDKDLELHLILDNYGTHTHPKVKAWLAKHPRFKLDFIPTGSSWLNLIERWFAELTNKAIRRGSFSGVGELVVAIHEFLEASNRLRLDRFSRVHHAEGCSLQSHSPDGALARLEAKRAGRGGTSSPPALNIIARRLERALSQTGRAPRSRGRSSSATSQRGRSSRTAAKTRKPASPETQQKRLAALERARAARAAKKAQAS